jgi:hypothetical protein
MLLFTFWTACSMPAEHVVQRYQLGAGSLAIIAAGLQNTCVTRHRRPPR